MTCGIYKISFPNTNKVYIGQSNNCERRLSEHKSDAKTGKWAKKLQEQYNSSNIFNFEILVECTESELDQLENLAIELYDSFNSGFNSLPTAESMPKRISTGEEIKNTTYTNSQITEAFDLLCNPSISFDEISEKTKVSKSTVNSIARGVSHAWLKNTYPDKWNTVQESRKLRHSYMRSAESRGLEYPKIKSPSGEVFTVTNVRAFAREHSLNNSALNKVLKRVKSHNSHKGWTVVTE